MERSHKPSNCCGYEFKTQLGENKHGIIKLYGFYKELVDLRLSSWIFTKGFVV